MRFRGLVSFTHPVKCKTALSVFYQPSSTSFFSQSLHCVCCHCRKRNVQQVGVRSKVCTTRYVCHLDRAVLSLFFRVGMSFLVRCSTSVHIILKTFETMWLLESDCTWCASSVQDLDPESGWQPSNWIVKQSGKERIAFIQWLLRMCGHSDSGLNLFCSALCFLPVPFYFAWSRKGRSTNL